MSEKEYIAYTGLEFTIEWYFTEKGESPALDYFNKLNVKSQHKNFFLFKRMGDYGKISDKTKFNSEGDKIFAFKPQPERFLSFFVKVKKIIVTNAFRKKTKKLPKPEKEIALSYRKNYLKRNKQGQYYEKKN
ncbi:MAG: type II toxin-antitoxin system RelE/ParE family toxin [archaeon]|nr:type II toxin-antitoxin system RelE/ParE family toxin [archaeon]